MKTNETALKTPRKYGANRHDEARKPHHHSPGNAKQSRDIREDRSTVQAKGGRFGRRPS